MNTTPLPIASPQKPGRVVIAGGNGFLGRNLAKHLSGLGREVVVLARQPEAAAKAAGPLSGVAYRGWSTWWAAASIVARRLATARKS